jgi:hypothetical protein
MHVQGPLFESTGRQVQSLGGDPDLPVMFFSAARVIYTLRLLVLLLRVDEIPAVVFVMVANPCHRMRQSIFIAALRCEIEEVVGPHQDVQSARIR